MERKSEPQPWAGHRPFRTMFGAGVALVLTFSAPAQNLFVSNPGPNGGITEITPGGVQSIFASGLRNPTGLTFDSAGNLYVAVQGSLPTGYGGIIKITPGGAQSTFTSSLRDPVALAFNQAGDLFVVAGDSIVEFTPGGQESTFAAGLSSPDALAFDSNGNLFVATVAAQRFPPLPAGTSGIVEFTPDGRESTFVSDLSTPDGLAFNSAGDLFVSDGYAIYEYAPDGSRSTFASFASSPSLSPYPVALAFNHAGNLFASVSGSPLELGYIAEITPDGTQTTFVPAIGNSLGLAFQPVPEPAGVGLAAIGAAAMAACSRSLARQFIREGTH
jgi:sugar lactone lactonase YvrE